MDHEQLRLTPDLIAVMRGGVSHALASGAHYVAPAHLLLALLDDPGLGTSLGAVLPAERIRHGAEVPHQRLPGVVELPEGELPDVEQPPFTRHDTLAFRARDGASSLYLDHDAYHLFIEGGRRAGDAYRPKHLVLGFTGQAVKDQEILGLLGNDPQRVTAAVIDL
jgi:Clp amino terminal domain, pathogenicity island component